DCVCPREESPEKRVPPVPPGATPLTRMSGASSAAKWSTTPRSAHLALPYRTPPPVALKADSDRVSVTEPACDDWSASTARLTARRAPWTLTDQLSSVAEANSSADISLIRA